MKYITFEKNEYYHELFRSVKSKSISSFWIYNAYSIECGFTDLPEKLQQFAIEIPENVAKGSWFSQIDLSQRKTLNVKVEQQVFEWVKHSFNIPQNKKLNPRDKFEYTITEEDEKNSVEYIKIILLDYLKRHYELLSDGNKKRYVKKQQSLTQAILDCKTNRDCHVIMHNYYNHPMLIVENKLGRSLPGAKWSLSRDEGSKNPVREDEITEQFLDHGPTVDTISSDVFTLKWQIGEPILVQLE